MTTTAKRDRTSEGSGPHTGWSLQGRTYVPVSSTPRGGAPGLDQEREDSMTDEGGPVPRPEGPRPIPVEESVLSSPGEAGPPAIWHWDLASGRVEWDEGLKARFGHEDRVTDSAWRDERIHPDDRARAQTSLLRATIASQGGVWSDRHRFRRADGSYVTVRERAYVLHDQAGPQAVVGAILPTAAVAEEAGRKTEEVP